GVVAMGLSVMVFSFMPYLDRSRIPGGAHYRPWYRVMFFLFVVDMLVLGYVGWNPPSDQTILLGRIATICYFGLFVLLPILSKKEERWLIQRGLPPELKELMASDAVEQSQKHPHRRSGDSK
ncbi:MAG: cytochrome b/b6, partial [Gallionella sp.]